MKKLITMALMALAFCNTAKASKIGRNQTPVQVSSKRCSVACAPNAKGQSKSLNTWVKDEKGNVTPVVITTYSRTERGCDRWTRRGISSLGTRLQQGLTIAADPRLFPYGTRLYVSGVGWRRVLDTGSAVISRLAARRRGIRIAGIIPPIIDVFFVYDRDARECDRKVASL